MRERWLAAVAPDVRDKAEQIGLWTRHVVDSELERSRSGAWRRLIMCAEAGDLDMVAQILDQHQGIVIDAHDDVCRAFCLLASLALTVLIALHAFPASSPASFPLLDLIARRHRDSN